VKKHTPGQRRAAHALAAVGELKENDQKGKGYGNFVSYVDRLPATIVMNGLGQAMASELAAARLGKQDRNPDEKAHEKLFDIVQKWLKKSSVYDESASPESKWLMKAIVEGSQDDYVRAQAEALAYLDWLKKFSQAYLKGE